MKLYIPNNWIPLPDFIYKPPSVLKPTGIRCCSMTKQKLFVSLSICLIKKRNIFLCRAEKWNFLFQTIEFPCRIMKVYIPNNWIPLVARFGSSRKTNNEKYIYVQEIICIYLHIYIYERENVSERVSVLIYIYIIIYIYIQINICKYIINAEIISWITIPFFFSKKFVGKFIKKSVWHLSWVVWEAFRVEGPSLTTPYWIEGPSSTVAQHTE